MQVLILLKYIVDCRSLKLHNLSAKLIKTSSTDGTSNTFICISNRTNLMYNLKRQVSTVFHHHVCVGGAVGGDILREAQIWGLGVPWGDVNSTGNTQSNTFISLWQKLHLYVTTVLLVYR